MSTVSIDGNKLPIEGKGGLIHVVSAITDPRSRRGVRHPIASVLALSVMAALSNTAISILPVGWSPLHCQGHPVVRWARRRPPAPGRAGLIDRP
jgi:hypothetical protein